MNQADDADGMGGPVRGPSFTFGAPPKSHSDPTGAASSPLGGGPLPVPPTPGAPPASKVPALVTLGVVMLVVMIAVVATVLADRNDARPAAVASTTTPTTAASTPPKGAIDFTSTRGSGRLRVVEHTWRTTAGEVSSRLMLEIEITCSSGRVDYDPYSFQAFDARGQLYDVVSDSSRTPLDVGSLEAGDSTRGFLEFEIPRGEVTLLMSNDNLGSVTALRIDD